MANREEPTGKQYTLWLDSYEYSSAKELFINILVQYQYISKKSKVYILRLI